VRTEDAVDRLLQGLERLEGRLARIEGRLQTLEDTPPPEPPPPPAATKPPPEERADPFQPAVVRAPASRHLQAVSRALSMLGLVPEQPEESAPQQSAKYKAAMQHALDALRGTREQEQAQAAETPAEPAPEAPVAETPIAEIAREVAEAEPPPPAPAPAPAPTPTKGMFHGALHRARAAAARLAGRPEPEPASAPEAPAAPVAAAAAAEIVPPAEVTAPAKSAVVPPPEVVVIPARAPKAEAPKAEAPEVDLETALQIDLERPVTGVRDYAAPILNALVLLAAAGGALYAGGAITRGGPAKDAWPEISTGLAAVVCGAAAWFWRSASSHLRAVLAGSAALLLNLVLLVVMPGLAFPPILVATACGLVALLGLRLVLETRHPLALFIGFGLSLLLPHRLAPEADLRMLFVAAINVATAIGALRLHRLQASVAAAALSAPLLYAATGPLAVLAGSVCAATYLSLALAAPFVLKRKSFSAAALAILAFGYAAWTVHVPYAGPGWFKAALLFGVAAAAALVAVRLPLRHALLRGVFKASSLLLLLAALPAGLETGSLAPSTLFLALLFGVFALALRDAFLRAAGALMLVVTLALFSREPAAAPLLLAASAAATVLCATTPEGPSPRSLVLLLGGAAHALLLMGLWRIVPAPWAPFSWLAVALAMQGAARRFPLVFLDAGAAIAAASAAAVAFLGPDGTALFACAVTFGALALLAPARRSLFLLAGEILAVAATAVLWPGPTGLLYALPLLALLPLPWPMARTHGRVLALVLLGRSLAPDVLLAPGDLATAAIAVGVVATVFAARGDRRLRLPALLLAAGAVGAWVRVRFGRDDWALWGATVALALGFVAAMPPRRRAPEAEPEAATEEEPASEPVEAAGIDQPSAT
jgi:hypothetical protein